MVKDPEWRRTPELAGVAPGPVADRSRGVSGADVEEGGVFARLIGVLVSADRIAERGSAASLRNEAS
ncbi:hypothetical protein KGQ20_22795 [Catenulispora sp. NF23]|uniref:hypothetical protein n=1 Tax=Catenulispora pinistramenti TaxID=2705254 RepID=UPI001BA48626|nr:hypothetical protein [Catenulispora pinistramenti]MBS2535593.1 hypothetical protein [Catenulispora pinistramenti]